MLKSFVMTLALVAGAAPALAAGAQAHSGTLVAVDPARHVITLQEMGPWTGPGTGEVMRSITFTAQTRIDVVERSKEPVDGGWPGGYVETPLAPSDLRPGDFATVEVTGDGKPLTAASIDVVRPSAGGTAGS